MHKQTPPGMHRLLATAGFALVLPVLLLFLLSAAAAAGTTGAAQISPARPHAERAARPQVVAPQEAGVRPADTISVTLVAEGLSAPTYLTAPRGDRTRLFVTQQNGLIRLIKNGVLLPTPFLDLSDRLTCCDEDGLLSMAFHPAYAQNGYFYVYYTNMPGTWRDAR